MIPLLIWRCPYCATHDALVEKRRLFRPLKIRCKNCGTIWRERREVGVDCWLGVIQSPSYPDQIGVERKSKEWYALIKAGFKLTPLEAPAIPLEEDEQLYLISRNTELTATADNPLFFDPDLDDAPNDLRKTSRKVGEGRVLLTNQRLIWEGVDGGNVTLPLTRLNSVSALRNKDLILLYEMHMISLRFKEESLLKWLTYFSKVSEEVQRNSAHTITTSRF
jgi:hypothetical protein